LSKQCHKAKTIKNISILTYIYNMNKEKKEALKRAKDDLSYLVGLLKQQRIEVHHRLQNRDVHLINNRELRSNLLNANKRILRLSESFKNSIKDIDKEINDIKL